MHHKNSVLVGLSGGVSSAIVAGLYKSQGYALHAVHFRYMQHKGVQALCSQNRVEAAIRIAKKLNIPLEVVDLDDYFAMQVLDPVLKGRIEGKHIDPCFRCRYFLILKQLLNYLQNRQMYSILTGHFVNIFKDSETKQTIAVMAQELSLDQSYYFGCLSAQELEKFICPLGAFSLHKMQKLAQEMEISEGLFVPSPSFCFTQLGIFKDYLDEHVSKEFKTPGVIRAIKNLKKDFTTIGNHNGFLYHYYGEKIKPEYETQEKYFVSEFDCKNNALVVSPKEVLGINFALVFEVVWQQSFSSHSHPVLVKNTAYSEPVPAVISFFSHQVAHVKFLGFFLGFYPGVTVAFYQDQQLMGGGVIQKIDRI